MATPSIRQAFEAGRGILRLIPNFVPRRFSQSGQRLRLHPDDYFYWLPLFHHLHVDDAAAALVGRNGKPEAYYFPPLPCMRTDERFEEKWVVYANDFVGAKELTVEPGRSATVHDPVANGCILIQGHGSFGKHAAEVASTLRFGQLSGDEFFVSEGAAREGVTITNRSQWEPRVILKHFGPNHRDMPRFLPAGRP